MNHQNLLLLYRLTSEEYQLITKYLGHEPSRLELALFSALWSEHCSYKSSAIHLKKLYFDSPRVLSALGENAGVLDLGQDEKIAFKIESHNHPSRITPYHGAATGVGGILRDVFVMNARPIALANYLCFGMPSEEKSTADLVKGVVRGIGGYGNSIGIPTVTGQTEFHSSYNKNIVMNALALGYCGPGEKIMSSQAKGVGNLLVYIGASTGKDGIHGASMASKSFKKDQLAQNKTSVQIGDPFYGKLLMEVCLESMQKNLVVAAQDMGAAGIISSSFEMISKGGLGMKLHLDKVPLRDSSMTPEEILLSESQERVLLLVQPDSLKELKNNCQKWELPLSVIGEITAKKEVEIFWKQKCLLKIDPQLLVEKAPRYSREYSEWKAKYKTQNGDQTKLSLPKNQSVFSVLSSLLQDIRFCSREFIYKQYDQRVGASTVKDCSFPFGVLCLPASKRALAICLGGRPHIMRMDSLEGGKDTVFEPALQLAIRGFTSLALTDGLNFASPEQKQVMSSFVACIEGMAMASRTLKTPVVSGNVSLYNETHTEGISPTPATAMVGIKDSLLISASEVSADLDCDKYKVCLLSSHQIFSKGVIAEFYNQDPCFYGTLDPKTCGDFISHLLKASTLASPQASRVVGKLGLAYTLANMVMESTVGIEVKTNYDAFQERLYEVIIVLKDSDFCVWQKVFCDSPFKIEVLGSLIKKHTLIFNQECMSGSELKKMYQSGWSI